MDKPATSKTEAQNTSLDPKKPWDQGPIGTFTCEICQLSEKYDYLGTKPPFSKSLTFLENCYIAKDPFSPPNKGQSLILGSHCSNCTKPICLDCSLYYKHRTCVKCLSHTKTDFPINLHPKIEKLVNTYNERLNKNK